MTTPVDTVRVEGPDATSFLQGQVSQDVEGLALGDEAWSFVLAPAGRVDAFVRVRRESAEAFALTIDGGYGEELVGRLKRFLLRTKATVMLVPKTDAASERSDESARIAAGIPAMGAEIDERCVPAETGWVDAAVSFTKGCFVGQELVARMDSRTAEPPRRLVRLTIDDAQAAAGGEIAVGGTAVGHVTSTAPAPSGQGSIALGYVKRGTALLGAATVGGQPATIDGPAHG